MIDNRVFVASQFGLISIPLVLGEPSPLSYWIDISLQSCHRDIEVLAELEAYRLRASSELDIIPF